MVINGSEVEAEMYAIQASVCQVISRTLVDISLSFYLSLICQTIHFVNKHLKLDGWVNLVSSGDCLVQSNQCIPVFILQRNNTT